MGLPSLSKENSLEREPYPRGLKPFGQQASACCSLCREPYPRGLKHMILSQGVIPELARTLSTGIETRLRMDPVAPSATYLARTLSTGIETSFTGDERSSAVTREPYPRGLKLISAPPVRYVHAREPYPRGLKPRWPPPHPQRHRARTLSTGIETYLPSRGGQIKIKARTLSTGIETWLTPNGVTLVVAPARTLSTGIETEDVVHLPA